MVVRTTHDPASERTSYTFDRGKVPLSTQIGTDQLGQDEKIIRRKGEPTSVGQPEGLVHVGIAVITPVARLCDDNAIIGDGRDIHGRSIPW